MKKIIIVSPKFISAVKYDAIGNISFLILIFVTIDFLEIYAFNPLPVDSTKKFHSKTPKNNLSG